MQGIPASRSAHLTLPGISYLYLCVSSFISWPVFEDKDFQEASSLNGRFLGPLSLRDWFISKPLSCLINCLLVQWFSVLYSSVCSPIELFLFVQWNAALIPISSCIRLNPSALEACLEWFSWLHWCSYHSGCVPFVCLFSEVSCCKQSLTPCQLRVNPNFDPLINYRIQFSIPASWSQLLVNSS